MRPNLLKSAVVAILALAAVAAFANGATKPSSEIMKSAEARAKAENKKVLLIFHASWCGWCKRLEGMLDDKEIGKLINKNYVITFLDVMESKGKEDLQNPGGMEYMTELGGASAGLPFFAILDANGDKKADSFRTEKGKKLNIGYPGEPAEIVHFMEMLKATAPRLSGAERGKIEAWLKEHAPKAH